MLRNPAPASATGLEPGGVTAVRHLRQVLLWPLRLMPVQTATEKPRPPWQLLRQMHEASPWREVVDEYTGDEEGFHERHYSEFVAFLPVVQRFLYGEGRSRRDGVDSDGGPPMRVFRRSDIAAMRIVARPGDAPITLSVVHVDLYFFHDVDVIILNLEVSADDLTLDQAQELLYRFGRGYPSGWDAQGEPLHSVANVEWLSADDTVLAESDARNREAFLAHVCEHRAPRLAAHCARSSATTPKRPVRCAFGRSSTTACR